MPKIPENKRFAGSWRAFSVESPAKINLLLKITGIRKDGYHNIASVFQMIDLCDTITFKPAKKGKVSVTCSDKSIPVKKNLAWLAAMKLYKDGLPGVAIHVEKNIPSGAGLGGGSSNAATVLCALNQIWRLGLGDAKLMEIGLELGADVPFFLFAPRAWVCGIGEKLTKLPPAEKFAALLVKPRIKVSTQKAYKDFDFSLTKPLKPYRIPRQIRGSGFTLSETVRLLQNDLEGTVLNMHPAIARLRRELQSLNGRGVMLTGSGSAMFVLFNGRKQANSALRAFSRKNKETWSKVVLPKNSMAHLKGVCGG
ncbi:MAG: 4-(cytidine 5'-diphospho)-2-C-methyl-D-erythritol kinase [Nitrospinae bacterium]|nr:4-(cytidine 5'-diphospho)-2-C-methyl-D-erythritol kinase [Nitrospinota bacterium]